MTFESKDHVSEATFEDYVEVLISDRVGKDNVHRQFQFESGRTTDFLVFDDDHDRMEAWELENDPLSLISGTGQSIFYRHAALQEFPERGSAIAVLAFPEGHINEDERGIYEQIGVQLREIDVPDDVSIEGV